MLPIALGNHFDDIGTLFVELPHVGHCIRTWVVIFGSSKYHFVSNEINEAQILWQGCCLLFVSWLWRVLLQTWWQEVNDLYDPQRAKTQLRICPSSTLHSPPVQLWLLAFIKELLCFNFRKRLKFPLCQIHKVLRLKSRSRKLAGQYPEEEVFREPSEANDRESAAEEAYTGEFRVFEKHCCEALFDLRS